MTPSDYAALRSSIAQARAEAASAAERSEAARLLALRAEDLCQQARARASRAHDAIEQLADWIQRFAPDR